MKFIKLLGFLTKRFGLQEENFNLREQNDDLASKLKKSEAMLNRLMDELAKYRVTNGKPPNIDIDEEERLRLKLKARS